MNLKWQQCLHSQKHFTGNEDRDYSKLNKEIYDIVTNNSGISKVENQLDGLSETITITNDYLIYTLKVKNISLNKIGGSKSG